MPSNSINRTSVSSSTAISNTEVLSTSNPFREFVRDNGFLLCPISSLEQEYLSRMYLDPHLREIKSLFVKMRKLVDERLLSEMEPEVLLVPPSHGKKSALKYPIGWCGEIRNLVHTYLVHVLEHSYPSPAIDALLRFKNQGGLINPVFGVAHAPDSKRYFHNTIQIGNYIVDCAVDALHYDTQETVKITSLSEGYFQDVTSFNLHCEVATEYWGARIFSTAKVFPYLAPFCPALHVFADGTIALNKDPGIFYRNIHCSFRIAEEFYRTYEFHPPELPPHLLNLFKSKLRTAPSVFWKIEENNANPEGMCQEAASFWQPFLETNDSDSSTEALNKLNMITEGIKNLEDELSYYGRKS